MTEKEFDEIIKNLEFYINERIDIDAIRQVIINCFPERREVIIESVGGRGFDLDCYEHMAYIKEAPNHETIYFETSIDWDTYKVWITEVTTLDKHVLDV